MLVTVPSLRRLLLAGLFAGTILSPVTIPRPAFGQDATWLATPANNVFANSANWSTGVVPAGTAFFGASTQTSISASFIPVTSLGGMTFNAGAPAYTFNGDFVFSGAGIVNNSSNAPTFNNASVGFLSFNNAATAGNANIVNGVGITFFNDMSSAGSARIVNNGQIDFFGTATAANATITNNGFLLFGGMSTAGNATIITNNHAITSFAAAPAVFSTGGNAQFITNAGGTVDFSGTVGPLGNYQITAGSIAGAGTYALGHSQLTVGGNDLSTAVSGTIQDGGLFGGDGASLTKTGTGVLTLTGTNTYSGGTTVTGGLINFMSANNFGSGSITLNGGGLQWATGTATDISARLTALGSSGGILDTNANAVTLASAISGTGGLTKAGLGTLTLTGSNTYSGGTTVTGGLVNFSTGSNLGTGAITLSGGGLQWATGTSTDISSRLAPLGNGGGAFDTNGNTVTLASAITGTGGLTKLGLGTLILGGANSYSGGTIVSGGLLQGTTSSLQGNIANNATVVFNQSGSGTYAGSISGTGSVSIAGGGMVSFTGASIYTGPTTVAGSSLLVNGSLASAVTADSASVIGGSGSVGALTVNGGILAPGNNSIGTLTVNRGFAQNGGTYALEVNAQGQSDTVTINGAATINGGTVQLTAVPGNYSGSRTYTILNATGGVSGAYSGIASDFAFLTSSLSYASNSVLLTLALRGNAFSRFGGTNNQRAIEGALDQSYASASGDFATVIGALAGLSRQQAGPALTAISGQPYADTGTAAIGASLLFLNTLGQQIAVARGKGEPGTRVALAESCDVACDEALPARLSAWMSGVGGFGSVGGNSNAGALTYNVGGAAAGIDYHLDPRFLMGVAVSYAGGRQWVDGLNGQGNTNNYSTALYASFTQGGFYADALAGYAYTDTQMQRTIVIPGLQPRIASSSDGTNQFLGQIEVGYGIGVYAPAQAILTPFARFQTVAAAQNGFTESGSIGSLGLVVAPQNTTSVRTVLGVDLAGNIPLGATIPLAIALRLGWAHEYASTDRPMTASFQGAPSASFTVYGATPQHDAAVIGLGLEDKIADAMSLYARYDGEIGGRDNAHAVTAGLRMSW
jgi:autotransporter-associated beta strand protein